MNNTMQNDYGKVDAATKSWNHLQYDVSQQAAFHNRQHNFAFLLLADPCRLLGCKNRPTPFPGQMS